MTRFLAAVFVLLGLAGPAQAYSYAAAGKEPLIDAREVILQAVHDGDFAAARVAYDAVTDEIAYLDADTAPGLDAELTDAFEAEDADAIAAGLRRAFAAEIDRRLTAGRENLGDYQAAKVLVVKSKRFFDAMAAQMAPEARAKAEEGLRICLKAIGNPGVFGVGRKEPDPAAYDTGLTMVRSALDR